MEKTNDGDYMIDISFNQSIMELVQDAKKHIKRKPNAIIDRQNGMTTMDYIIILEDILDIKNMEDYKQFQKRNIDMSRVITIIKEEIRYWKTLP